MAALAHLDALIRHVRTNVFGGNMSQGQVDGISAILAAWVRWGDGTLQRLSYVLAPPKTSRLAAPISRSMIRGLSTGLRAAHCSYSSRDPKSQSSGSILTSNSCCSSNLISLASSMSCADTSGPMSSSLPSESNNRVSSDS
jgi:hypothetical protein